MAHIIDERQEQDNQEEEYTSLEVVQEEEGVVETPVEEPQLETTQQEDGDDLPEKYRGKSAKEIARMHQEAEKMMGRHSSEVGELRSIVDSFIKTQLETKKPTTNDSNDDVVDDVDFYVDPKKAVEKALNSHPAIRQAEQMAQGMQQQNIRQKLQETHPDYMQVATSGDFIEWVKASPVRTRLLVEADQKFDFDSANELLTLWKDRQGVVSKAKEMAITDRKQAVKQASNASPKGSSEGASKKIYRRADIMSLLRNNPDRYNELYAEITRAYDEGRVRG
jgi:hypothetical protein